MELGIRESVGNASRIAMIDITVLIDCKDIFKPANAASTFDICILIFDIILY